MSNNTIRFGDNTHRTGLSAFSNVAAVWGVNLKHTKDYTDAAKRLAQWRELVTASHTEIITDQLDQAKPEEWEAILADKANEEAARAVIKQNAQAYTNILTNRQAAAFNHFSYYENIVKQLPLDDVEAAFIDAARQLGPLAWDKDQAIEHNPEAIGTLVSEGKKLRALASLPGSWVTGMNHNSPSNFAVACRIETLPPLRQNVDYLTVVEKFYTDDDLQRHYDANGAKSLNEVGELLTRVAQDQYPGVELHFARTADELRGQIAGESKILAYDKTQVKHDKKRPIPRIALL